MKVRSWIVASAVLAATAAAFVGGCSSATSSNKGLGDVTTGSVGVAMSAVGPDGATYTLNNVWMNLSPTGDAGAAGSLEFNSATGTQSFSVAAGSYAATLTGGPGPGTGWTLNRAGDGGANSVSAVLLDAEPYNFTIGAGATTTVTLHFEVANVGNVTFSAGTLTTALSVDAGTLPAGHTAATGSASFSATTPTTSNTALNSLLTIPSGQTISVPYAIALTLTSPFTMSVDQACANVTAQVTATAQVDGGAEDAYAAWFQEVSGATGYVCINDGSSPWPNMIEMVITRGGAATTTAFGSVSPDGGSDMFQISAEFVTNPAYLSNGVLSISSLSQPVSLPIGMVELTAEVGSGFEQASFGGNVSFQISP